MATVRLDQKKRALVRSIPSSFTKALARYFGSGPTDVELARQQQQAYVDALEANGVTVHRLDADENHPDCMFVEDQAVGFVFECEFCLQLREVLLIHAGSGCILQLLD